MPIRSSFALLLPFALLIPAAQARWENPPPVLEPGACRTLASEASLNGDGMMRLHEALARLKEPDQIDAPELILPKLDDDREILHAGLRRKHGETYDLAEVMRIHQRMHEEAGRRMRDGVVNEPEGQLITHETQLEKLADGKLRSFLQLGDEARLRIGPSNGSGLHGSMAWCRPVRVAGEIAFSWRADKSGTRRLVVSFNPKSRNYNDFLKGPRDENFNTYAPLERVIPALAQAGIHPDAVEILHYETNALLATVNLTDASF